MKGKVNNVAKEYLKCGAEKKFTVIKNENIEKLPFGDIFALQTVLDKLPQNSNEYIVINTDEPYISEIIDILKKNNAWG